MGRKKIDPNKKIMPYSISLKNDQINWLNKHPSFTKDKFFRYHLDKYIKMHKQISDIS